MRGQGGDRGAAVQQDWLLLGDEGHFVNNINKDCTE